MTQRALAFTADLDISDVSRGLRRIEMQSRRAGASVGRVGAGIGRAVSAGAGIGAGAAIFEMLFQKVFEIFEGTPILETFTSALDTLLTAFGPVVGVLLEALLPAIVALTPAIEPLARAMTPLIELMGAGLLVAIQLLIPGITLWAQGLEKVTTVIRDVVLSGIQFVVDQLNKLPFVDIQANLDITGNSFDTMAGQLAAAGDESEEAEGKVGGLGDAVKTTGEAARAAGIGVESLTEEMDTAAGSSAHFEQFMAKLREEQDRAAMASALWTQVAIENKAAADELVTSFDSVSGEMDEMYTASDRLGQVIAATKQPVSALDAAVAAMTMEINAAKTASDLQTNALAALTPELRAAAMALGLFGLRVAEVNAAADGDRPSGRRLPSGGVAGGSSRARPAPGPRDIDPRTGMITATSGFTFQVAGSRTFFHIDEFPERAAEVEAAMEAVNAAAEMATAATMEASNAEMMATMATMEATAATMTATTATSRNTSVTRQATTATMAATAATMAAMPEVSALEALLAQMTMTITDTAAATELQEMALAALSPELRALAEELGLFGLRVADVAGMVQAEVAGLGGIVGGESFEERQRRESRSAQNAFNQTLANEEYRDRQILAILERLGQDFRGRINTGGISIVIDGESVARARMRAESEGAM